MQLRSQSNDRNLFNCNFFTFLLYFDGLQLTITLKKFSHV